MCSSLRIHAILVGVLLICVVPFPVIAQSDTATSLIEEIVVTARKRAENLQTVPVAISAFSTEALSVRGIDATHDLAMYTPSLQYSSGSQGGSSAQFFIRGIGQLDFISTVDPGVGVYVDGVYVARTAGSLLDLTNVERVEVLRGPQGTLFGKNTIGGAINVTTSTPDDEFRGNLSLTKGRRDRTNVKGFVNVPLADNLYFSGAFSNKQQDGFGRNVVLNQDPNSVGVQPVLDEIDTGDEDKFTVLGKLRWVAADNFEVTVAVDHSKTRETGDHTFLQGVEATPGSGTLPDVSNGFAAEYLAPERVPFETYDERFISDDIYTNYAGHLPGNNTDIIGGSVTGIWEFNEYITIKSITAYRDLETRTGLDFDVSPIEFFDQTVNLDQWQFSQELQVFGSAFDSKLDWLAGLYYIKEDIDSFIRLNLSHSEDFVFFPYDVYEDNQIDIESFAAFFQGTYSVTDNISITAGVRYTTEEKTLDFSHELAKLPGFYLFEPGYGVISDTAESVTPKVSVEFITDGGALFYVSATKGFKSHAFNGRPFTQQDVENIAQPEEVWSYEAGAKIEFLNQKARLNAAIFHSDYSDLQATICRHNGVCVVQNAAGAEIRGAEIELNLVPVDRLRLDASVSILDDEYDTLDPEVAENIPQDGDLIQTPDYTFTVGGEYTHPVGSYGNLSFRVDYFKTDEFYHNPPNGSFDLEPSYELVNARITFTTADERWSIAGYGLNIGNEEYAEYREDLIGFGTSEAFAGARSEYGVEVSFQF